MERARRVRETLERERGFEPPAACLEGRFSTNLSYSRPMVPCFALNR
jgi:hypothetical protein